MIFIFGVLAALLLPALQSSGSTAHRNSCANNRRQIGLAFTAHTMAASSNVPIVLQGRGDDRLVFIGIVALAGIGVKLLTPWPNWVSFQR